MTDPSVTITTFAAAKQKQNNWKKNKLHVLLYKQTWPTATQICMYKDGSTNNNKNNNSNNNSIAATK